MPSTYAHYRFGTEMLAVFPADVRRTVQRFRRLYDVGLHGPDLFFYYNPAVHTPIGSLGGKFHHQTGREFFGRFCRSLRLSPSEAGLAYLYGVLAHFCLDSVCHPFINRESEAGPASHVEIETEFDRFLLEADGKLPIRSQERSSHIRLTPGECETVSAFYSPAKAGHVRVCVNNMDFFTRLLANTDGSKQALLRKGAALFGRDIRGLLMPAGPNPRCACLDEALMVLYGNAASLFPVLCAQIQAHLAYNAPLGEEFSIPFD